MDRYRLPNDLETEAENLRKMRSSDDQKFAAAYAEASREFKETLKNVALGIGTTAAAALVLLSSEIQSQHILVIVGIVLLFLDEIIIFFLVLKNENDRVYSILTQWHDERAPIGAILNAHQDVVEHRKEAHEFIDEWNKWSESQNNAVRQHNESTIAPPPKKSNIYFWCITMFFFGAAFVVFGMLYPYFLNNKSTNITYPQLPDAGFEPR
ncbi:MAG TPA: hypothetical protein VG753_02970 [Candidatus Paceibacterota bacterium]|nr:hypothetical protein [Candidatus Paceibacterota bacterium]